MRTLASLIALTVPLAAEIIDRVEIAIGHEVITASQIDEELRVTALLNHGSVTRSAAARRDAADRLVQQFLIKRETEVSHFPGPDRSDIDTYLIKIERDFGGAANLDRALSGYDLNKARLKEHLALQLTTLRFIEFRFRPESSVNDADAERRTDEALNIWLEEARKRFNIIYLDKALQ